MWPILIRSMVVSVFLETSGGGGARLAFYHPPAGTERVVQHARFRRRENEFRTQYRTTFADAVRWFRGRLIRSAAPAGARFANVTPKHRRDVTPKQRYEISAQRVRVDFHALVNIDDISRLRECASNGGVITSDGCRNRDVSGYVDALSTTRRRARGLLQETASRVHGGFRQPSKSTRSVYGIHAARNSRCV